MSSFRPQKVSRMKRRDFLDLSARTAAAGLGLGLAGCARRAPVATAAATAPALPWYDVPPPIAPIRAHVDRLFRITVCLRPFRAAGPRIEAERVGDKLVVHNYGHGGSGWSLSWGSSGLAVEQALGNSNGARDVAVLGCGALGLTSATLLQRAGARVTIYARERPPDVRSSRATGSWTPDSRIALTSAAPTGFAARWERMARASWAMYQSYLGMPGNPVEYTDQYNLSDAPRSVTPGQPPAPGQSPATTRGAESVGLDFARYEDSIADITPGSIDLPPGTNPFPALHARRTSQLRFNIADYARQLYTDFLVAGGRIETVEFHSPSELQSLQQKVVINCTGYGARQLWADESIIPVRGQIGWLIPQPEANYGFSYWNLNVLSRRDGIVVQVSNLGEATGWKDDNETPDRAEAEGGVRDLAALYDRMKPPTGFPSSPSV
jgi:glycine/D-amino acid oxidase-like deaminating enzyme